MYLEIYYIQKNVYAMHISFVEFQKCSSERCKYSGCRRRTRVCDGISLTQTTRRIHFQVTVGVFVFRTAIHMGTQIIDIIKHM